MSIEAGTLIRRSDASLIVRHAEGPLRPYGAGGRGRSVLIWSAGSLLVGLEVFF